jgi:hypothetical protein
MTTPKSGNFELEPKAILLSKIACGIAAISIQKNN